jgi:hypothetical protein
MSGKYQPGPAVPKVSTNGGEGSWDPTVQLCPVVALMAFPVNISSIYSGYSVRRFS